MNINRIILIILLLYSPIFAEVKPAMTAFNAGEVSPLLLMRHNFSKYDNACKQLQNMLVLSQGPVMRRPGTYYIAETKTMSEQSRLIPFEFSKTDTYMTEAGNEYMRFYRNGGQIVESVGTEELSLNNIVAHWLLNDDEDTTVLDDDGATHNGTASANCGILNTTGKVGTGCFDLDGQYTVEMSDHADFSFTDDSDDSAFSIACWAYIGEQDIFQVLLSKWRDISTTSEWRFSLTNDQKLQLHLIDSSADLSGNVVAQWKLNDDAADTNVISSAPTYTIDDANDTANTFTISDDGDLSASFPDASEFTVAGSTGNDSQYTVTGTSYGAPDFVISVAAVADGTDDGTIAPHAGVSDDSNTDDINATGKISGALDFGGDQAMVVDDTTDFTFGNGTADSVFSVSAWIYVTSHTTSQQIIAKWDTNTDREWTFNVTSEEILKLTLYDESANARIRTITDDPLTTGWHFVVGTYDATEAFSGITLYVDNVVVDQTSSGTGTYVAMENLTSNLSIGASYNGGALANFFQDKIDNVILFDIELTAANISALWNDGTGIESLAGALPSPFAVSDDALTAGWHFLACTYSAPADETTAADGIILYVDGAAVDSTATNDATYTAMQGGAEEIRIGSQRNSGDSANESFFEDKIDEVSIFSDVLTATEVASLYSTTTYEIETPYTESEVFELQYVQLADVMYIVQGDHEPRKLTRTGHTDWTIADVNYIDGPFLDENTDTSITITPSATTGAVTLTGSDDIWSSDHVGALWEIRHPRTDSTLNGILDANESSSAIACEGDYKFITHGTWTGTVKLERTLDGSTYETVYAVNSADDTNIDYSDSEPDSGYEYRVKMTEYGTTACTYSFIVYDHMHTGVVKINTFVSPTEVAATVYTTLGGTGATYYWSEGYWSDKNGWPETIEFHEFRLWYGGNEKYPQTIWASRTDDFEKMKTGSLDSHAIVQTLPGQNPIQWLLSHTYLMIGTLGGAGRMGDPDEEITPTTKPTYRHQTTDGSAYIQAVLAGDAILYVERGGQRVREFVYAFEKDKFVSPDMTVLAEHITGDGIEGIAFQSRPEKLLWSYREDGNFLSMSYNREQDVVAWSENVTDGDVESIEIIPGTIEDEVWFIINRTIDSSTVRYIERMKSHGWGSDDNDTFFVDCGLTFDGGDSVVITNVTKADPAVVTVSTWPTEGDGTSLADDDQIKILAVVGMTELNGNIYTIDDADTSAKTFSLNNSGNTANIDSGSYTTYSSGGTAQRFENSFSGFDHLEGETVSILGDGTVQTSQVVSTGAFSINNWVNKMHAGLPYTSILETMPITYVGQKGSVAADKKQISQVAMNFYESLGTKYGVEDDTDDVFTETSLYTGWKKRSFQHGFRTPDTTIYIEQVKPLPLTVRAIIPTVTVTE